MQDIMTEISEIFGSF